MIEPSHKASLTKHGVSMIVMTHEDIWQDWSTAQSDIQQRWTQLTPGDLEMIAGDRERLVVRIVDRYGIAKEWAEKQVIQWERRLS